MRVGGYRKDIDGLRAFAVLFVTIFHINESLIPGGFIGVDIFFVISGYLITEIIIRDHTNGNFSFSEFYRRRIKRIFPAMFLVTGTTLIAGFLLLLPEDVEALSWSALATLLSGANIYFTYFLDTSYFAADSATVPLLHMWSLGVEEQFYLFWPALLLILLRWPRIIIPALLCIGVASVWLGEWMLMRGRLDWAYYMLPTRSFQLAAGGLLAFLPIARLSDRKPAAFLLALAGAVLCIASAVMLDGSNSSYPGINALPVTVGAALLLAAGVSANPISRMLSWTPLRWIGLISYSLYLWHWPVLAFQRYFYPELSVRQQVASFVVMVALAWLSYRFVEQPTRKSTRSLSRLSLTMAAAPASIIAGFAFLLIATAGWGPWSAIAGSDGVAALSVAEPPYRAAYVCQGDPLTEEMVVRKECMFPGSTGEPTTLLWGDSNAAHYVGAIREISAAIGMSFRNISHSACPPVLNHPERFAAERFKSSCAISSNIVKSIISSYDKIIISASWDNYIRNYGDEFLDELRETVDFLKVNGKSVMIIGITPRIRGYDRLCERKYTKFPFINCGQGDNTDIVKQTSDKITSYLNQINISYVDFYNILCQNDKCDSRIDDIPMYYDSVHLSVIGLEKLGKLSTLKQDIIGKFMEFSSKPY